MNKNDLINEIEKQINKAYDDCNFDALDYLEHLLKFVKDGYLDKKRTGI